MKKVVILMIYLFSLIVFSQYGKYENCEDAKLDAISDFKNNNLIWLNTSYSDYIEFSSIDSEFEDFVYIYIYSKYSISQEDFYQNPSENLKCYSNVMDSLIYKKFGKDVIKKSRKEAKEIYLKKSEKAKAKIIDLDKIYSMKLHSEAKFIGNDRLLIECFRKEIKTEIKTEETLNLNFITLIIDENGVAKNIYLIEKSNELESKKKKLLKEINNLGSFVPAYLYGKKVKSKIFFYY